MILFLLFLLVLFYLEVNFYAHEIVNTLL